MNYTKKLINFVAIVMCFFQTLVAQSQQILLPIVEEGRKMFHEGKQIKNTKILVNIIEQAGDNQASTLIRDYHKSQKLSLGVMGVGVGVMAIGLGQTINQASDPLGDSSSGGSALLGGAVIMLVGVLINLPKVKKKMKPAVKRYNLIANKKSSLKLTPTKERVGIGLSLQF